jgi:SARP family transcriptional regulator, regulator of embCAB operon
VGGSVKVSLLGSVSIEGGRRRVEERQLPGRQGRLLFAYLLCERERPVPRDEPADVIWGDALPATWEKALVGEPALVSRTAVRPRRFGVTVRSEVLRHSPAATS